jgi:hypothetical protein
MSYESSCIRQVSACTGVQNRFSRDPLSFTVSLFLWILTAMVFPPGRPEFQWARSSVVGRGTLLQSGRSWVRFPMGLLDFSTDIILPATL